MRQQYHLRNSNKGILSWDVFRLIELSSKLEVVEIPLSEISELDEEFWYDLGGVRPTCRDIVEHAKLISNTDLSYPIILCHEGRRAFRILCQLILTKYLRRHPNDLQNESPVETMSYSSSGLALSIS